MKSFRAGSFLLSLAGFWIAHADEEALLAAKCESAIASADADSDDIFTAVEYANFLADFLSACSIYSPGTALTTGQFTVFSALCLPQNGLSVCSDATTVTVDFSSGGTADMQAVCASALGGALIDGCDPTQSIVQIPTLPPQSLSPDFDIEECSNDLAQANGDQNDLLTRTEYSELLSIRHPECYTTGASLTPAQEAVYIPLSCFFCAQQTQNLTCCLGDDVGLSIAGARNSSDPQYSTYLIAVCGAVDTAAAIDCGMNGTTTTPLPPALPSTSQPTTPVSQPTNTLTSSPSAPAAIPNKNSPSPTRAPVESGGTTTPSDASSASQTLSWNGMVMTITCTILAAKFLIL